MTPVPFLNWFERWAVRILYRSPRVGLLVIKEAQGSIIWYAQDPLDPMPGDLQEPASLQLERLYHLPAYGEQE